ncbi:MAG: TIGR00730 family Rossman fold protein [Chitinophagaceae bacterium]|nr:TIGR00730 family Rossman fold protein [Chitinophagaceae bacterium]
MKKVTVFCGSSFGTDKVFEEQAYALGKTLALKNIGLVYGGASIGLMGAVANGVLDHKGEVVGVLPDFLRQKEIAHAGLTELIIVDTMHERKTKMNDLCDGVITLPGGFGTMEEFFEMLTWAQLGLHGKPIGLLNTDGFYTELLSLVDTMVRKGFLKKVNQDMLLSDSNIDALLEKMMNYQPPAVGKWIKKDEV